MFAILMLQDGVRILLMVSKMVSSIFVDISVEFEIVILRWPEYEVFNVYNICSGSHESYVLIDCVIDCVTV